MRLLQRLLLLSFVSLIGLLIFGGYAIDETLKERAAALRSIDSVETSLRLSALVHELQRERGLSAGFIGAAGGSFTSLLAQQRTRSDALVPRVRTLLRGDRVLRGPAADATLQALDRLEAVRQAISALELSLGEVAGYYTGLISGLLAHSLALSAVHEGHDLVLDAAALANIQEAKEAAGLERAMGANGFGAGRFSPSVYRRFIGPVAAQEARLESALKMLDPRVAAGLEALLDDPAVKRVDAMRAQVDASMENGTLGGITGTAWFDAATARLEILKQMEDRVADLLTEAAAAQESNATHHLLVQATILAAIAAVCTVTAVLMARSLSGQYRILVHQLEAVGQGNLDVEVTQTERTDEIGDISRALESLRTKEAERQRLEAMRNRQVRLDLENAHRLRQLVEDFQRTTETNLNDMVDASSALTEISSSLETAVNVTREGSTEANSSAAVASDAVQTVAGALDRMAESVSDISRQLDGALSESDRAASTAEQAAGRIEGLEKATGAITTAAQMIADIAEQTNLLALNATIEAERAGTAGRGFAIVASEVKSLAEDTGRATEDISAQIRDIQKETSEVVGGISEVLKTCSTLREMASAIQAAMMEQREATRGIAESIHEITSGSARASELAARVLAAADTSSEDAGRVRSAAGGIDELSRRFRKDVSGFIRNVATA